MFDPHILKVTRPTDFAMSFCSCRAFLGGPACWTNFFKLIWIIAYSIQKELWKNSQPFSCNNFLTKYERGPATPLKVTDHAWQNFKNILDHSLLDAKEIMEKYSSVIL